ncbi:hypothetical protein DSO57_1038409 [Entomophthora muscae]|uniref:Uncharacterized protein n=1 Tax=Entomophthora muscae TaxID=34485 RepID=A0ACC2T9M9_9FUNG|nr:hypothetical protein DSO57_1038409 [Entomophthora muscae]
MASKLKLLAKKSWCSLKSKLLSVIYPTPEEKEAKFDIKFSPPTVVCLEESVFTDYATTESSSDSSVESLPIYSSQTSQVLPEKPVLKSCICLTVSAPSTGLPPSESEIPPSYIHSTATSVRQLRRQPHILFKSSSLISESSSASKVCRFSENVVVYETYNSDHYPREAAKKPNLTPKKVKELIEEICHFKLSEMKVHPDSFNNMNLHNRYNQSSMA